MRVAPRPEYVCGSQWAGDGQGDAQRARESHLESGVRCLAPGISIVRRMRTLGSPRDEKLPGAKIDLAFKQRPVGFKFRLRTPMSVLSVAPGSHAETRSRAISWHRSRMSDLASCCACAGVCKLAHPLPVMHGSPTQRACTLHIDSWDCQLHPRLKFSTPMGVVRA